VCLAACGGPSLAPRSKISPPTTSPLPDPPAQRRRRRRRRAQRGKVSDGMLSVDSVSPVVVSGGFRVMSGYNSP
jgi:hypothetical protein